MDTLLRAERTKRALRPAELADQVGVHPMSILRWERRERLPGPRHISALATALGLDPTVVAGFFDEARSSAPSRPGGARGHGLRPLRRVLGLSAATLARHCGVGVATVYNWEAGRARIPRSLLPRLAELLDVELDRLDAVLRSAPAEPPAPRRPSGALRRLRQRSRLSQEAAATAAGVHRHTLSAWERGGARPSLAAARRLARAYGVPLPQVAEAAGIEPPPQLDPRTWRPGDLREVLRTLRAWTGATQRRLAETCGCSPSSVRAWESGRSTPRPAMLRRLERAYGLPAGALQSAV